MLKKAKIDALSVFFVLSIAILLVSWYDNMIVLKEQSVLSYYEDISFDNNVDVSFHNSQPTKIEVLNSAYQIFYSVNGGDDFKKGGSVFELSEVRISDKIISIPTSVRWLPPKNCFKKVKSVSVLLVDEANQKRSDIHHFVNTSTVQHGLPIAHITISENDLIGEKNGLNVLGCTSWSQEGFYEAWWDREGNFRNRGTDWERSVSFQLFEEGVFKHKQQCGMRISGNATRGFSQKSFRFKARKLYDEDGKFKYRLFGNEGLKKYESFVLRMSGNDNPKTLFADAFMQKLAEGSNLLTQKSRPVVVYINGNYWGIYNLRERIDDYYVAKYEDSKAKHVTILEDQHAILKDGDEKDKADFDEFIKWFRNLSVIGKDEMKKIENEIDIDSYIDYIFFETFYANNDWPHNNAICYRIKKQPWKWLLNDLDYSLAYPGLHNVNTNMFDQINDKASVHVELFNKLIINQNFKSEFKKRAKQNIDRYFNENQLQSVYLSVKEQYDSEIQNQIDRWRMINSIEDWEKDCQNNLEFIQQRRKIYKSHLEQL